MLSLAEVGLASGLLGNVAGAFGASDWSSACATPSYSAPAVRRAVCSMPSEFVQEGAFARWKIWLNPTACQFVGQLQFGALVSKRHALQSFVRHSERSDLHICTDIGPINGLGI